jgi:TonB family protein
VVYGDVINEDLPEFPALAKAQQLTKGTVVLQVIVGVDGRVRSVAVVASSNPVFEPAAVEEVRLWRDKPSTVDGKPAEVKEVLVIPFQRVFYTVQSY